jgi:hypothetical protein
VGALAVAFLMYAQIPLLAASAGLVIWRMGDQRYTAQQLLAACALIAIFLTARQGGNLFWAMQLAFPMYLFFSVLAFTAVDVYRLSRSSASFVVALVAALLASVSNGAGLFALVLTVCGLFCLKPSHSHLRLLWPTLALAVGLFGASQWLSTTPHLVAPEFSITQAISHEAAMIVHAFTYAAPTPLLAAGSATAAIGLVLMCLYLAARDPRAFLFPILLILLSLAITLATTYARIKMGVYQPDAGRYIPLVAPMAAGCVVILYRSPGHRLLLNLLIGVLVVTWGYALHDDWTLNPHRRAYVLQQKEQLCLNGMLPETAHISQTDTAAIKDIQTLFCPVHAASADPLYQWRTAAAAPGQVSVAAAAVRPGHAWTGLDFARTQVAGLQVYSSYVSGDADTGSIFIHVRPGDRILYRSGPTGGAADADDRGKDHAASGIDGVEHTYLNDGALQSGALTLRLSDDGAAWGEWSAIAVTK